MPSSGRQVLTALDAKLDGVITTAAGVAGAPAAFLSGGRGGAASSKHAAGGNGSELDYVLAAKNAYLRAIEDAVQLVKVLPSRIKSSRLDIKHGIEVQPCRH